LTGTGVVGTKTGENRGDKLSKTEERNIPAIAAGAVPQRTE